MLCSIYNLERIQVKNRVMQQTTYGGNVIDHQGWDEGSVRVIRHDYVGFLTEFMDAMGFEGWGFYCLYECRHQFGHDRFEYTLINGATSDEKHDRVGNAETYGPTMDLIKAYLGHIHGDRPCQFRI